MTTHQRTELYATIKNARQWLKSHTPALATPETITGYETAAKRLCRAENGAEIIALAANTTSPRTWFYRRAALSWYWTNLVRKLLARQDKLQRKMQERPEDTSIEEECAKVVQHIPTLMQLVESLPTSCPLTLKKRRRSKRLDLRGLPQDWREQLLNRLPKYRLQFLTAAVFGCRPAELARGVRVKITQGQLVAIIAGVKVSSVKGQPERTLTFDISHPLAQALAQAMGDSGSVVVKLDAPKGPKQFSNAMTAAAHRLWPKLKRSITPYCLRHQSASDWKASGFDPYELASALGHSATATQAYYGYAKSSRSRLVPKTASATRVPKSTHTDRRKLESLSRTASKTANTNLNRTP